MNVLETTATLSVIAFALFFPTQSDNTPIAKVEVLHSEVEIEYVDTTTWNRWVFDTDTTMEYMFFNNETGEITYIRPPNKEELERARVIGDMSDEEPRLCRYGRRPGTVWRAQYRLYEAIALGDTKKDSQSEPCCHNFTQVSGQTNHITSPGVGGGGRGWTSPSSVSKDDFLSLFFVHC